MDWRPGDQIVLAWITNPDNIFRGNVATGAEGHDFWYVLPEHPMCPSQSATNDAKIWSRRTALKGFSGNLAHSNGLRGLNADDGPLPDGTTETTSYEPHVNPIPVGENEEDSPIVIADFADLTAYKNGEHGVWLRGNFERLTGAILADNLIGATFASYDA